MSNLERVYEAIAAMQNPNPLQSAPASTWLEDFQKTIHAWTAADQILVEARSFEACLFAAQTLRNKVLYSIRELPADSYAALRDSLLTQLCGIEAKLGQNASSILIQLCAALSDLYIQVLDWHGFVHQMLGQLATQAGPRAQQVLLCLFKTLPEELYSRKLKVGENRRAEVEQELAAETQKVLTHLSEVCAQNGTAQSEVLTSAVNCLASWLLNKKCPAQTLAHSPLLQSVIGCLAQRGTPSELHDAATECLVNALQLIDDTPRPEQLELATLLHQGVFATLDAFRAALREEDSEKLQNYARLYAEHCEAFLSEIAKHPREGFGDLRALEMLQLVNDYHEYNLMEMSFNVWYRLSEYLYQCEESDFDELREFFIPFVEKHILALCRHCRAEPDSHELLDPRSELADFRSKAQESVKDVTFIFGSVNLLRRLMELLNSADSWDQMEAILFVVIAFVPNIVESERLVVPTLLEAILKLPMVETHKQLLKTSAQLLGNLQDWLQANSDYMVRTFNWFCSLFEASAGQMALTVAECMEQLMERGWQEVQRRDLHDQYMLVMEGLVTKVEQSHCKAHDMEQAAQHLLRASAHLVNDLPSAKLCAGIERLCAKSIARLNEINKMTSVPPDPQPSATFGAGGPSAEDKENMADAWLSLARDPILWLDRLSAVWRVVKPWQQQLAFKQMSNERQELGFECPWQQLCSNIIHYALSTLQQHQQKRRTVEHACRTIRFLIRSMGAQSIRFIEPVANQIMLTYAQFPHSCLLYLASILVDEYGTMHHVQQGMHAMLETLATRSFSLLAADPQNGLRDNPDTVDDLYRLAIRFVQRIPCLLFLQPIAVQLFQGAIHGLNLNHTDANRSVSKYILEIIDLAKGKRGSSIPASDVQRVNQIVSENGPQLMFSAISATLFHLSKSLCKEMAEIVFSLIQLDKQKAEHWLQFTCQQLPHGGGNSATPEQLNEFRANVLSADRPYDVLVALRELGKFYP